MMWLKVTMEEAFQEKKNWLRNEIKYCMLL
jgi:hypothetical protein